MEKRYRIKTKYFPYSSHTPNESTKAKLAFLLSLRVCIVEHSSGYILHHMVMEKQTDSDIVVEIIKQTQKLYPDFMGCSFDKGFHSPSNQIKLAEILDDVVGRSRYRGDC